MIRLLWVLATVAALAFGVWFLFALAALEAQTRNKSYSRRYHRIPLAQVPTRQFTYIETCGLVTYVTRVRTDQDLHITLECPSCPKGVVVVEIVPELTVERPRKGQWIRVRGLRHFDDWHNWYEVRPLNAADAWSPARAGCR